MYIAKAENVAGFLIKHLFFGNAKVCKNFIFPSSLQSVL